jgi:hypothetical protein
MLINAFSRFSFHYSLKVLGVRSSDRFKDSCIMKRGFQVSSLIIISVQSDTSQTYL